MIDHQLYDYAIKCKSLRKFLYRISVHDFKTKAYNVKLRQKKNKCLKFSKNWIAGTYTED